HGWCPFVAGRPAEHEPEAVPGADGELADRAPVLATLRDVTVQPDRVRAGDRRHAGSSVAYPGNDVPVVEPQFDLAADLDRAGEPFDDPHQAWMPVAGLHEVHDPDPALAHAPLGFQHEGVAAILPARAGASGRGCQQPTTRVRSVEQRGEARR